MLRSAYVDLFLPFWLSSAPPPMPVQDRIAVLQEAEKHLKAAAPRPGSGLGAAWASKRLEWRRRLETVPGDRLWYPFELARRKGAVLVGEITGAEDIPVPVQRVCREHGVQIAFDRRAATYFDYGLGAIEYSFVVRQAATGEGALGTGGLASAEFWRELKDALSQCVATNEVGALKDDAWAAILSPLSASLIAAYQALYPNGRQRRGLAFWRKAREDRSILRGDRIFSSHAGRSHFAARDVVVARRCANFGINVITEPPDQIADPKEAWQRAIDLTGIVIGTAHAHAEQRASSAPTSEYLAFVTHGPVDSLVILAHGFGTDQGAAALRASRTVLHLLWLAYNVFVDASSVLVERQIRSGAVLASTDTKLIDDLEEDVFTLQRVEQMARLAMSDFDVTTFYGSEVEQDIYCTGFQAWAMEQTIRHFRESLEGVGKIEQALSANLTSSKLRTANIILAVVAALTIISAAQDLSEFSSIEVGELKGSTQAIEVGEPKGSAQAIRLYRDVYIHQDEAGKGWRLIVAPLLLSACGILCFYFWRLYRRTR